MLNLLGVICAAAAGASQVRFSGTGGSPQIPHPNNFVLASDEFDTRQPHPRFRHIWFSRERLLSIATI